MSVGLPEFIQASWMTSDWRRYGEPEIADFLTDLAVTRTVTAGTQNQALCGLLFFYEKVLGRELRFINSIRAKLSRVSSDRADENRNRGTVSAISPVFIASCFC